MELYIIVAALIIAGAAYLVFAETDPDSPKQGFRANQIAANICEGLESPLWRQLVVGLIGNRLLVTSLLAGAGTLVAWLQNTQCSALKLVQSLQRSRCA